MKHYQNNCFAAIEELVIIFPPAMDITSTELCCTGKNSKEEEEHFRLASALHLNNSDGNGELESVNEFYNKQGNLVKTDSINQHSDF